MYSCSDSVGRERVGGAQRRAQAGGRLRAELIGRQVGDSGRLGDVARLARSRSRRSGCRSSSSRGSARSVSRPLDLQVDAAAAPQVGVPRQPARDAAPRIGAEVADQAGAGGALRAPCRRPSRGRRSTRRARGRPGRTHQKLANAPRRRELDLVPQVQAVQRLAHVQLAASCWSRSCATTAAASGRSASGNPGSRSCVPGSRRR